MLGIGNGVKMMSLTSRRDYSLWGGTVCVIKMIIVLPSNWNHLFDVSIYLVGGAFLTLFFTNFDSKNNKTKKNI